MGADIDAAPVEACGNIGFAFKGRSAAEAQLKRWKRDWKIELIERENLEWRDLSDLIV